METAAEILKQTTTVPSKLAQGSRTANSSGGGGGGIVGGQMPAASTNALDAGGLTFGPAWLRQLSSGDSSKISALPPSPGLAFQLAKHRYGREEMLAIYEALEKQLIALPAPASLLNDLDELYKKDLQRPVSLTPPSLEEQKFLSTCVNSQVVLNSYNKSQGLFSSSGSANSSQTASSATTGEYRAPNSSMSSGGRGGESGKGGGPGSMRGGSRGGPSGAGARGAGGGGYNSDRASNTNGPGSASNANTSSGGGIAASGGRGRGRGRPNDYTKPQGGDNEATKPAYSKSSSYTSRNSSSTNWDDKLVS